MNILTIELEWNQVFHILPHFSATLGKSCYFNLYWLNIEFTVKHISSDYKAKSLFLFFPSMTLQRYPTSGYRLTFEISALGYFYRKGLFRRKDADVFPIDNTHGFVTGDWFKQFQKDSSFDMMSEIEDLFNAIRQKYTDIKN